MRTILALVAAALAALATPAFAQEGPGTAPPSPNPDLGASGNRVTVAVGIATLPDYEGADDNVFSPAAAVVGTVGGFDFFTRGTQLYVDLVPDAAGPGTKFELGAIAAVRRNRVGNLENNRVEALGSPKTAFELGAFAGISRTGVITSDFDTLTARVGFVHDVSDHYDSYVITPQLNYTTPLSYSTLVSLGVSADYVGKGYGRAYYSVTPIGTIASGLRTYSINDSGFSSVNGSFFVVQSLSGDLRRGFGIGAGVFYGKLLGKYKNSPIVRDVGDADQLAGAVGLTYTF